MRLLNVLIVDDEPDQLELTRLYLLENDSDITIETACSGKEALKKVEENNYDCIVLDHVLPDFSGMNLAERIKKKSSSPIILYTSKGSEDIASKSLDFGVDSYMMKESSPEHFKILDRRIRSLADRHSLELLGRAEYDYEEINPPDYPKVEVRGRAVYIVNDDGSEDIWCRESSEAFARVKAKEIDSALNDIKAKRNNISKLMHDLMEMEVPAEYRNELIDKGYIELKDLLNKLNQKRTTQK